MQQRAANLDGEARRALESRLVRLDASNATPPEHMPATPSQSGLRELVADLSRVAPAQSATYPEISALADFRRLWSTLHTDSQWRQSAMPVPANAGPLNSAALASRAITLMRELSPTYLRAFLAYVDDLAWLEQLDNQSLGTSSASGGKKRARHKPRA